MELVSDWSSIKLPFLDVLISINNTVTTFPYKKITLTNSCTFIYKSKCPEQYKLAIIRNLICCIKLISFYFKLKNIKHCLINNDFPNHIVDRQIKHAIKNINSNYKGNNTTNNPKHIKLFFHNQMHIHYKLNEIALKNLICDISLMDSKDEIKLIVYYPKYNTTNLIISYNFSPSASHFSRSNVVYEFKCPLGEYFSKISTYISLTTTVEMFNTSPIQH